MIRHGNSDREFYAFTKDAAAQDYPILRVEMEKSRVNRRTVLKPVVREKISGCVGVVGVMDTVLAQPLKLVDFSGFLPSVQTIEIIPGHQKFEILSIEFPKHVLAGRFLEIAVLPGTVYGLMWQGLIHATVDYHRVPQYWANRSQLKLPFAEEFPRVVEIKTAFR